MRSIKEKAVEYAKTKHTKQNLIEIVSWDFESGANYVLDTLSMTISVSTDCYLRDNLRKMIEQLKNK